MRTLLITALTALALAAGAAAGGWATAGVTPLPSGEGTVWTPTVTVLQHGRTPLDGVEPVITIRNEEAGTTLRFPAAPTGKAGVYSARVEFPSPGAWSYTVYDGFGQTHTFKPVQIGAGELAQRSPRRLWAAGGRARSWPHSCCWLRARVSGGGCAPRTVKPGLIRRSPGMGTASSTV